MQRTRLEGTLKELLRDWEDWDIALYKLAICLGLMPPDDGSFARFREAKYVFWSNHPVGDSLRSMLDRLVADRIIEFDDEEQRYRWSPTYRGDWESGE